jgi:hypothetical protein
LSIPKENKDRTKMAIKTIEKKFGDNTYYISSFPATQGLALKFRLADLLGPVMQQLAVGINNTDDITIEMVGKMVGALTQRMSPDAFVKLVLELMSKTMVSVPGKVPEQMTTGIFDSLYSDNYMEMYNVIAGVLEVNWKGFFAQLLSSFTKKEEANTPASSNDSQTSSTES